MLDTIHRGPGALRGHARRDGVDLAAPVTASGMS